MRGIRISALQWGRLQDLHTLRRLDDDDIACMRELREVLARHGRLDRFALQLVHKHFELAPHEVLVEYSDPAARELRLRVEARDGAAARAALPTAWMLDSDAPVAACVCAFRPGQGHLGRHGRG